MINKIPNIFNKFLLLLYLCKLNDCSADSKIEARTDLYFKMCSVFKLSKFCSPYVFGSYAYPFYTLPIVSGPLPVAPFPLIINPTSPQPSFTIPTIFTTPRPGGPLPNIPQIPNQPFPNQPFPNQPFPNQPFPGILNPQCPSIIVCPPAALTGPIDPRQGIFAVVCLLVVYQV